MVQRIWRQLGKAGLADSAYFATGKSQIDIIQNQLGNNVPLIVEPERRDTFPAISLAAVYLHSYRRVREDEVICVVPVDAFVEEDFFQKVKQLEYVINDSTANLALIGVCPTHASEQYGYIVPYINTKEKNNGSYLFVKKFAEKPEQERAKMLISKKALWNCGVFAFRLGYLINFLTERDIPINFEELLHQYPQLPRRSFDLEVAEKIQDIVVVPYEGNWGDLGTWDMLTSKIDTPVIGTGTVGDDSNNTHLINELDIPAVVLGVSNIVSVISPDGILIADKSKASSIKELIKHIEKRPMYEERRWGWYRVLDYNKLENGTEVLIKRLKLLAGKNLSYQMHLKRKEIWTIISGEGELVINGKFKRILPGDVIQIPVGTKHAARANSDLEFIEVQLGSELVEEDVVRFFMAWKEIEEHLKEKGEKFPNV
jgi:mannose-1-phosphate guanylyltransferase